MENNRWTDGLTVEIPKAEKLTEDGRKFALKAVSSRTPIDDIPLGRKGESDEDREAVRNGARQEVARLFGLKVVEKPTEEIESGEPQAVPVEQPEQEAEAGSPQPVTADEDAKSETELTPEQIENAVTLLKKRHADPKNQNFCPKLSWEKAETTLRATPKALETVLKAEEAGHEPTICLSDETGFEIATRSDETPPSTRNCVYDAAEEKMEKKNYPNEQFNGNAVDQAREMGWDIQKQKLARHIAANTPFYHERGMSWFKTSPKTRKTNRALYGYRSGDYVYVARSAASDHGGNRGWRGSLRVNFVA